MICDFPFLLFSHLSDEPLPGRNKFPIVGRNALLLIHLSLRYFNSYFSYFRSLKHNQRKYLSRVSVWQIGIMCTAMHKIVLSLLNSKSKDT